MAVLLYPPICPPELTTLWHGISGALQFLRIFPTALEAFGCSAKLAMSPYVDTFPDGIFLTTKRTCAVKLVFLSAGINFPFSSIL